MKTPRTTLIGYSLFVIAAMVAVTSWASLESNVIEGFKSVWSDRWGAATLFDAYFAFLFFYLWVFYKEPRASLRLFWLLAILSFGNMAMAAYLIQQILKLPAGAEISELLLRSKAKT